MLAMSDNYDEDLLDLLCVSEVETMTENFNRRVKEMASIGPRVHTNRLQQQRDEGASGGSAVQSGLRSRVPDKESKEIKERSGTSKHISLGRGRLFGDKQEYVHKSITQEVREVLGTHHHDEEHMKLYRERVKASKEEQKMENKATAKSSGQSNIRSADTQAKKADTRVKKVDTQAKKADTQAKKADPQAKKENPQSKPLVDVKLQARNLAPHAEQQLNSRSLVEDWLRRNSECSSSTSKACGSKVPDDQTETGEVPKRKTGLYDEFQRMKKLYTESKDNITPQATSSRNYVESQTSEWCPVPGLSEDFNLKINEFPDLTEAVSSVSLADEDSDTVKKDHWKRRTTPKKVLRLRLGDQKTTESGVLVIENLPKNITRVYMSEWLKDYGTIEEIHLENKEEYCKAYVRATLDVLEWIRSCFDDSVIERENSQPLKVYFLDC